MQHQTRPYSYDDQDATYVHMPPHQSTSYAMPGHTYQRSYEQALPQYYASSQSPQHATQTASYTRPMSVSPESHRYAGSSAAQGAYYPSQNVTASTSSGPAGYVQAPYYNPAHYDQTRMNQNRFIPTPSELANSYSAYPVNTRPMSPNHPHPDYYASAEYQQHMTSPSQVPIQSVARVPMSSRPRTTQPTSPSSTSSPTGERFPCEKCGKTFSRSHDRKRHHETQHHPTPAVHRCRYCDKEFSRADSLKRHLDNGCDEMP